MEMSDLEEQVFAKKYFLHYGQWQRVLSNKEVLARVNEWRKELIHIRRSKAIKSLEDIAFGLDTEATIVHRLQALKYLVDQDFGAASRKDVTVKVKPEDKVKATSSPIKQQPLDVRINKDFERMLALTDDITKN